MSLILLGIFVFISSILQGITGFGFAVIAAPLILSIYDIQTTVVILTIVSFILNSYLSIKLKNQYNKRVLLKLIFWGSIGIPLGIFITTIIPTNTIKVIVSVLSMLFVVLIYIPKMYIKPNNLITYATGLLTGILQSSIGVSGPPVVLMLTSYKISPLEMKKILAIFFLTLSTLSLPLFFYKGILTIERGTLGLLMIPITIFGGFIGNLIAKKISVPKFRLITLSLVVISSVQLLLAVFKN